MQVASGTINNPIMDVCSYADRVSMGISYEGHLIGIDLSRDDASALADMITTAVTGSQEKEDV